MRTKFTTLLAVIMLIAVFGVAQKRTVKTKLSLTENTFYIKSVSANKYLDLPGYANNAQKQNGASIKLWDLDDGNDRKIKFIDAGNGYYYIRFQHTKANMDVHGCYDGKYFCGTYKKDKGANVQIWSAGNSKPQQWDIQQIRAGQFKIINRYSGKVLDATGTNNGSNVVQWTWHGGNNQLWEIIDTKTAARYQQ